MAFFGFFLPAFVGTGLSVSYMELCSKVSGWLTIAPMLALTACLLACFGQLGRTTGGNGMVSGSVAVSSRLVSSRLFVWMLLVPAIAQMLPYGAGGAVSLGIYLPLVGSLCDGRWWIVHTSTHAGEKRPDRFFIPAHQVSAEAFNMAQRRWSVRCYQGQVVAASYPVLGSIEAERDSTGIPLPNDTMVSRRHAVLAATPSGVLVTDLNSANGTYVNGQRITQLEAGPGQSIQIGSNYFQVFVE